MGSLNIGLFFNLATSILSAETLTSKEQVEPHKLNCPSGEKIFLHSACYSECSNNKLADAELEELYRNCSYVDRCTFKTKLDDESSIYFACEDENLHRLPFLEEKGLEIKSSKALFYYDGREYKSTGGELLCVINPSGNLMNVYVNRINIQATSKTVLEMVVSDKNMTYSTKTSIYRSNTKVNSSVTFKILPDSYQHDQISLGFTIKGGTLDVNCSFIETSGTVTMSTVDSSSESFTMSSLDRSTEPLPITGRNNTIIIIACLVSVAIIVIIIVVACIIYRISMKCMARREERGVKLTRAVSGPNNYSDIPRDNTKQRKVNNYDYATPDDVIKPQNTFNNTSSNDVNNPSVSRDGQKIINMKQLESTVKSSGYSEPIDSVKPITISSKAGDYAEPCNEKECFTSKCLQNKAMLQNYDDFQVKNNPKSGENSYSHVVGSTSEDDYDHFDRIKGNNSRLPDRNYSHIPVKGLIEDDYNTTSHILSEETTPNPYYDH